MLVVADLSPEHRDDVDIDYEQVPPIGGPHDPEWLACGAYDEPLRDENAVHDLEHGTVWITYDPALAEEDVAALEAMLPDDGILSPYPGLPAPVVITVWGAQLRLDPRRRPAAAAFLDEYGDGGTAPEALASCEGGDRPTRRAGRRASTPMHQLSLEQARRIAVRAQLLDAPRPTEMVDVVRAPHPAPARPDLGGGAERGPGPVEPARVVVHHRSELRDALDEQRLIDHHGMVRPSRGPAAARAEMALWPGRQEELKDWERDIAAGSTPTTSAVATSSSCCAPTGRCRPLRCPDTCQVPWRSSGWNNNQNVKRLLVQMVERGEVATAGRDGRQQLWDLRSGSTPTTRCRTSTRRGGPATSAGWRRSGSRGRRCRRPGRPSPTASARRGGRASRA